MKCFRLRCCVNNSFLVFHQGTKHSKTIKHSRFALAFHTVFSCLDPLMKHSNSLFTYNFKVDKVENEQSFVGREVLLIFSCCCIPSKSVQSIKVEYVYPSNWACTGIEPVTSRTLSENHTTRPASQHVEEAKRFVCSIIWNLPRKVLDKCFNHFCKKENNVTPHSSSHCKFSV